MRSTDEAGTRALKGAVFWIAIMIALTACSGAQAQLDRSPDEVQKRADVQRHAVVISIDGVPADYLWNEEVPLPTIRNLAKEGVWAEAMVPSTPTKTWTNHTTLATGVHPATHRMFTNGLFTEVKGRRVVENGGSAMVFATEQAEAGDLERARSILKAADGIARVVGPEDYARYDLPPPSEEPRVGDLFLDAAPGHASGNTATGDYRTPLDEPIGKHGYSNKPSEMNTLFVASGSGIQSGATLDTIDIRSVAPTVARLLGLELDTAEGKVLESILE